MANNKKAAKSVLGPALLNAAEKYDNLVLVSADSGPNSGFSSFIEKYPDRFYEFGIMEPGVISAASGMATTGWMPLFCAPAPFVCGRAYEMVRIDCGYMRQNVKLIGRNCGFSYNDLGPTHYGLDDIALMRAIPEMVILAPQFADEVVSAFDAMMEFEGPIYMRVHNAALPEREETKPFVIGKGEVLVEGDAATIISTGNVTQHALAAAELLKAEGINVSVIGMPTVYPLDEELILGAAAKGKIFTVEEHFVDGGLGSAIASLTAAKQPAQVIKLGVPNIYCTSGPYDELLHLYGIDAEGIAKSVKENL